MGVLWQAFGFGCLRQQQQQRVRQTPRSVMLLDLQTLHQLLLLLLHLSLQDQQ